MQTGAVLAVTLQEADQGDMTTVVETLVQAGESVAELIGTEAPGADVPCHFQRPRGAVADPQGSRAGYDGWELDRNVSALDHTPITGRLPGGSRLDIRCHVYFQSAEITGEGAPLACLSESSCTSAGIDGNRESSTRYTFQASPSFFRNQMLYQLKSISYHANPWLDDVG